MALQPPSLLDVGVLPPTNASGLAALAGSTQVPDGDPYQRFENMLVLSGSWQPQPLLSEYNNFLLGNVTNSSNPNDIIFTKCRHPNALPLLAIGGLILALWTVEFWYIVSSWLSSWLSPAESELAAKEIESQAARGRAGSSLGAGSTDIESDTVTGKKQESDESSHDSDDTRDQDAPEEHLTWITVGIWIMTGLNGIVNDTCFSILAPFLPGEARLVGLTQSSVGFVYAVQPLGVFLASLFLPWLMHIGFCDAYSLLRRAALASATGMALMGITESVPALSANGTSFGLWLGCLRFTNGVAVAVVEIGVESIQMMILPRRYVGLAAGIQAALRFVAVAGGLPFGGYLYELGCWVAPFMVTSSVLCALHLVQLFVLGRHAPKRMHVTKKVSPLELLKIWDVLTCMLPSLVTNFVMAYLEPAWQPFLGSRMKMTPGSVGSFMMCGFIVNVVAMLISGATIPFLSATVLLFVGTFLQAPGLLLTGPSPLLMQAGVPQTPTVVLIGTVLFFGGLGLQVPSLTIIILMVYERAGYSQKQVAGLSSALFVGISALGNTLGPPIGGALIDQFGFEQTVSASAIVFIVLVILPTGYVSYKYRAWPEKGCLARPSSQGKPRSQSAENTDESASAPTG